MKIDFKTQLELEFPGISPLEMNGKKEISMLEVSKLLNKQRLLITKKLVEKNIFFYLNGRYMPNQKYINQSYFRIDQVQSSIGLVPKLVILFKGYYLIKEIILNGK